MHKLVISILFIFLVTSMFSQKIKWEVDTVFSEITFDVNHLIFTNVDGEFFGFDGIAYSDSADFSDIKITFVVYPKSLKTDKDLRDETLKSDRFLDVDNYKTIVFTSIKMGVSEVGSPMITGLMTMFGVKKLVSFNLVYKGGKKDMHEREFADFEISGTIYPEEWGWNNPPFVSKKVRVQGKVRLIKIGLSY